MSNLPDSPTNYAGGNLESEVWGGKPIGVSQDFGIMPDDPKLRGWYAYSADYGWPAGYHIGIDVAMPEGTPIHAAQSGTVIRAGLSDSFRPYPIWIREDDGDVAIYGHLGTNTVNIGQKVSAGQLIGTSLYQTAPGNPTVRDSGDHLHFELRKPGPNADGQGLSGYTAVNPAAELTGAAAGTGQGTIGDPAGADWANVNRWDENILNAAQKAWEDGRDGKPGPMPNVQGETPSWLPVALKSMVKIESGGDPDATASGTDRNGNPLYAGGLTQITNQSWWHDQMTASGADISDPDTNLYWGALELMARWDSGNSDPYGSTSSKERWIGAEWSTWSGNWEDPSTFAGGSGYTGQQYWDAIVQNFDAIGSAVPNKGSSSGGILKQWGPGLARAGVFTLGAGLIAVGAAALTGVSPIGLAKAFV